MIFDRIEIENFFRIREKVVVQLNKQGLVLITGENGNGKSTIFEALVWCLEGVTVRGYKADQVVNRDVGKDCCVTVVMSDGVVAYRVTRYRKHRIGKNKLEFVSYDFHGSGVEVDLTQQTNEDTQSKIREVMGIDFDTFTNGPMMPQGSFRRFSEMTDSEIKGVLEKAVQISVIAKAQEKAKQEAAAIEVKIGLLGVTYNKNSMCLEEKEREIVDLEEERENFDTQKAAEVGLLSDQLKKLQERLVTLEAVCPDLPTQFGLVTDAKNSHQKISELYEAARKEWEEKEDVAQTAAASAVTQHTMMSKECERLTEARGKIKSLKGTCPKCGQDIPASHIDRLFSEADQKVQEVNTALKIQYAPKVHELQEALKQVKLSRDSALEKAKEIWLLSLQKIHDLEKGLEIAASKAEEVLRCKADVKKAQESLDLVKNKTSPFEAMIQRNLEDQARIKKEMLKIVPKLDAWRRKLEQVQFWVEGFSNRGLKSFVLGSIVPFMNSKAEEYSQVLTGGELEIRFHTQTTLKSGETREKFYVEVANRTGAEDYIGSSGGERRRADLAISFTLSDLVSARSKKAFPQRFFDEPFENLDEAGVEAVMQLLQGMVAQSGSIFVVTHQDHLKSMFNKTITVEKINGVTRIS